MNDSTIDLLWAIVIGTSAIVALATALVTSLYLSNRKYIQLQKEEMKLLRESESKFRKLAESTNTLSKANYFSSISTISFHFVNKDQVKTIYHDYFKELSLNEIVSELGQTKGTDAKASVPKILETTLRELQTTKLTRKYKLPDISVAEMFRQYQLATIENNQVTLGIELVELDDSELERFNGLLLDLAKFGYLPNELKIEEVKVRLKNKSAEKTILRLDNITGWILLEAPFLIESWDDSFYKFTFDHPVNKYIDGGKEKITITFLLRKDSIESNMAGNYARSIGETLRLRVFASVWKSLNRSAASYSIEITPLAVY